MARVTGRTCRLIASRFPIIGVFDDIAEDETDLRAAFDLEEMTSGRMLGLRRMAAIPGGGVVHGPGASMVMAAFLHASEEGGRFTDGRLGAWYAATEIATAIEETVWHNEQRLRASAGGFPNRIQMRELVATVDMEMLDLRGSAEPGLYDPLDYVRSQAFAMQRRWPFVTPGLDALVYDSVRRPGGVNLVIFRPAAVPAPVMQGEHYEYVWDAQGKLDVLLLTNVSR